jgi:hypothetical protein
MQSVLDEVDYNVDNGLPPTIEIEEEMSKDRPTLTERMERVESTLDVRNDPAKKRLPFWGYLGVIVPLVSLVLTYYTWWEPHQQKVARAHC